MNQFELNKKIEAFIKEKDSKGEHYSPADIEFIQQLGEQLQQRGLSLVNDLAG